MKEPQTLRLRFVPTKAEIEELNERLTYDAHGGSKWRALGCLVFPVLLSFVALAFQVGMENIGYLIAAIAVITTLIMIVQRRAMQDGEEVAVEIDAHGIRLGTGDNRTLLKRSTITKLIESDSMLIVRAGEMGLMLPKRTFDSEADVESVRELIDAWAAHENSSQDANDSESADSTISVSYQLKFRDYISKLFVSWTPRLICVVVVCLCGGASIAALADPPAEAAFTELEMLFYFIIPFTAVMCIVVFSVLCVTGYLQTVGTLTETHVTFSRQGLRCRDSKHDSMIDWKTPTRYKETRRLICIWWPGTQGWLMIPKRSFESDAQARAFAIELDTYAQESTWFWG